VKMAEMRCLWCETQCGDLEGLMLHLLATHDRFAYTTVQNGQHAPDVFITVRTNQESSVAIDDLSFVSARRGGPPVPDAAALASQQGEGDSPPGSCSDDEAPSSALRARTHMRKRADVGSGKQAPSKCVPARSCTFTCGAHEHGGGGRRRRLDLGAERQVFRSMTCLPIAPGEEEYDSDDDVDSEWQLAEAERAIDEYDDIAPKEKVFMKVLSPRRPGASRCRRTRLRGGARPARPARA